MSGSTQPSEFVTDTMGLVLCIEKRKMGPVAKSIFESVESGNATVYVPAVVALFSAYVALVASATIPPWCPFPDTSTSGRYACRRYKSA